MRRVLVDTSVWVEHFSGRRRDFAGPLTSDSVCIHELVFGELVIGTLPRGSESADDLMDLPLIPAATHAEVLAFVRRFKLEGSGINWPDAHILAAAHAGGAELWTLDQPLIRAAVRVGVPA
jgi:predicted nucleic acid-binding protein